MHKLREFFKKFLKRVPKITYTKCKIDYFALGVFINYKVAIYDLYKRYLITFLIYKYTFTFTISYLLIDRH